MQNEAVTLANKISSRETPVWLPDDSGMQVIMCKMSGCGSLKDMGYRQCAGPKFGATCRFGRAAEDYKCSFIQLFKAMNNK